MDKTIRLGALSNRNFRQIFFAYAFASFGDWFDMLAIQVLVAYRWDVDPLLLALIPATMGMPGVLLGSFAGTMAWAFSFWAAPDRERRRAFCSVMVF
ncbi:MFS transporter [Paenibacillus sediminis]|uniref:MFS transporter n=1 Tax=Paenibacillus sediminis TaxID=664909 RepID=A0ABS4H0Q9_9BACL|nr:MFS transporter [Paenibacillus sediminis]MBP1936071.1 hypothetical protein [Paenibacillus sediminis]